MHNRAATDDLHAALLDAGLHQDDIDPWRDQSPPLSFNDTLKAATDWAWEGIPGDDAVKWHSAGWRPRQTVPWWVLGFTPEQASFVRQALATPGGQPATDREQEWLRSGLSSADITLCVAAGILDAAHAQQLAGRLETEPSLRGSLTMRAVLHGADIGMLRGSQR